MHQLCAARGVQQGHALDEDVLTAARRIYQSAGFVKVKEEPHSKFGYPSVSETWELKL